MVRVGQTIRQSFVDTIKQEVEDASGSFLINYSDIAATDIDEFRKELKSAGARMYVAKNRLVKIALKELGKDSLGKDLNGQTAFVWTDADSVAVAKSLKKFAEKFESVAIQGGVLDGALLSRQDVARVADLPSRDILIAQLLQVMLSPMTSFAGVLNAKTRDLLSIFKQLSEKKEGGN